MAKKGFSHFCRGCGFVWESKNQWVVQCPKCHMKFNDSFSHQLRNVLYGDDRHPRA